MSTPDDRLFLPKHLIAKAFGISVQAVTNWDVKPQRRDGREALYYLPEVIAFRLERDNTGGLDLEEERARLASEQADKAAMENRRMRRELLPASQVQTQLERLFGAIRSHLLALPTKLAPQVLVRPELPAVQAALRDGIHVALHDLERFELTDEPAESDQDGAEGVSAASDPDRKSVGRRRKAAKPRVQRRTGPVAD